MTLVKTIKRKAAQIWLENEYGPKHIRGRRFAKKARKLTEKGKSFAIKTKSLNCHVIKNRFQKERKEKNRIADG